jgi:predicted ATPase
LERVNHFLRDSLRTRYRLECQHFTRVRSAAAPAGNSPSDPLSARVAEDPPPAATRRVPSADETIATLTIVEADTGLTVSHRDVGTGISQLLPVLVNAAGAKERLIAIEQPELHLHPALQAELGDVFIESALGANKNTFLIETHSEHLILRLLKRIRQTTGGMNTGLPPVRPEDVAILYVQPTESGSVVKHLRVDQHGRLMDDWPGGFFEESFNEMF